jgi:hypothetical protein
MALHGFGDLALARVEKGVVQGQPGPAGDVLQQSEVGCGESFRLLGAAQGRAPGGSGSPRDQKITSVPW